MTDTAKDELVQKIVNIVKDQIAPLTYDHMFPEHQGEVDALLRLIEAEATRRVEEERQRWVDASMRRLAMYDKTGLMPHIQAAVEEAQLTLLDELENTIKPFSHSDSHNSNDALGFVITTIIAKRQSLKEKSEQ